jgi:integrase
MGGGTRRVGQPDPLTSVNSLHQRQDLRHTAVALWIATGATPKEVAARAGHTSVLTVLDRYGHLLPGTSERVNEALDALARDSLIQSSSTGEIRLGDVPHPR